MKLNTMMTNSGETKKIIIHCDMKSIYLFFSDQNEMIGFRNI